MWRHLCSKLDILVHPAVERTFVESKHCCGLVCRQRSDIPSESVLALIPFYDCAAPNIALASPWGPQLRRALMKDRAGAPYELSNGRVAVSYAPESAVTMVFTALATHPSSPLHDYLRFISIEDERAAKQDGAGQPAKHELALKARLGPQDWATLEDIRNLNLQIVDHIGEDAAAQGLTIGNTSDEHRQALHRAHYLCESRCVDVPFSEEVLGGPAFVPFVDLINHDDKEGNVVVGLASSLELTALAKCGDRTVDFGRVSSKCPFFIVVRAASNIDSGDELTYQYVDQTEDPELYNNKLYWASRFHFLPV